MTPLACRALGTTSRARGGGRLLPPQPPHSPVLTPPLRARALRKPAPILRVPRRDSQHPLLELAPEWIPPGSRAPPREFPLVEHCGCVLGTFHIPHLLWWHGQLSFPPAGSERGRLRRRPGVGLAVSRWGAKSKSSRLMSSNYMRVSHGLAIAAWGPRPGAPTDERFLKARPRAAATRVLL